MVKMDVIGLLSNMRIEWDLKDKYYKAYVMCIIIYGKVDNNKVISIQVKHIGKTMLS